MIWSAILLPWFGGAPLEDMGLDISERKEIFQDIVLDMYFVLEISSCLKKIRTERFVFQKQWKILLDQMILDLIAPALSENESETAA